VSALRASWRMVLRFLHEPTSSISARVSATVWASLLSLSGPDPHSTALYFFDSSVFTFLNISAYCAPELAHLLGIRVQNHAHLLVNAAMIESSLIAA